MESVVLDGQGGVGGERRLHSNASSREGEEPWALLRTHCRALDSPQA